MWATVLLLSVSVCVSVCWQASCQFSVSGSKLRLRPKLWTSARHVRDPLALCSRVCVCVWSLTLDLETRLGGDSNSYLLTYKIKAFQYLRCINNRTGISFQNKSSFQSLILKVLKSELYFKWVSLEQHFISCCCSFHTFPMPEDFPMRTACSMPLWVFKTSQYKSCDTTVGDFFPLLQPRKWQGGFE